MFLAHRKIPDCNSSWYCILDVLFIPSMHIWPIIHTWYVIMPWKPNTHFVEKCHPTLTNNLNLHNFLLITESGSLSYWTQHTKLYKWGKFHALIIFWKLLQLSSWTTMSPISMPTSTLLYPVFPGWLQYAADTAATKCVCLHRWSTEALKGHRVFWKIAICYLVRVIQEWKRMSSGWHNNMFITHPEEISTPAKSSGWHMMVWYVIRTTYCSVHKSSEWKTVNS